MNSIFRLFLLLLISLSLYSRNLIAKDIVDLISPTTCDLKFEGTKLLNCKFPAKPISLTGPRLKTLPLVTILRFAVNGNCSTPFPISIKIGSPDSSIEIQTSVFEKNSIRFEGKNAKVIQNIQITDAGENWTRAAVFDASCRVILEISPNENAIRTKEEAQKFLESLRLELKEADLLRDAFGDLITHQTGIRILRFMNEHYEAEISNQDMQDLRQLASRIPADFFSKLFAAANDDLSNSQKIILVRIEEELASLKNSSALEGKKLSDILGDSNQNALRQLEEISSRTEIYSKNFEIYSRKVENLKLDLSNAESELASLLNERPTTNSNEEAGNGN